MAQIYGIGPVLEALHSGKRHFDRILIGQETSHPRLNALLAEAKRAGVPVRREPRTALDRLSEGATHQGVIAIVTPIKYLGADDLLKNRPANSLLVLLDGVEDPHNLGAIVRTAECAGAYAVIIPERRSAHVTETVVKASAGATEHIPITRVSNLASFLEELKKEGFWIVALDPGSKTSYADIDYSGQIALVLGGEGHGLHRLIRERSDFLVSIPMKGHIQSLNVSVSAGVVLFEAVRKRSQKLNALG